MTTPEPLSNTHRRDRVVLVPRDPECMHAYWEIPEETVADGLRQLGADAATARTLIRVHDVTDLIDPDTGKPRLTESQSPTVIEVEHGAGNWYIHVGAPDRVYCAEYVVAAPDGRQVALAQSNLAAMPANNVSTDVAETWTSARTIRSHAVKVEGPARTKWVTEQRDGASSWAVRPGSSSA